MQKEDNLPAWQAGEENGHYGQTLIILLPSPLFPF